MLSINFNYKYIIFFQMQLITCRPTQNYSTNVHFNQFGFILMHDLFFSSVTFYSVFLCLGMWGSTPIQSFTFKRHDHNFVSVLFFYFCCVQCFRNTFLAINQNLNVSRRIISNTQFPILCHVTKVPNYCANRRSCQTGRQTKHYLDTFLNFQLVTEMLLKK